MDTSLRDYLRKKGLADRTARVYVSEVRRAQEFVENRGHRLARATFADLEAFCATRPHTRSTTKLIYSALKYFFEFVGRADPPLHAIPKMKKPRYHCRALDDGDAARVEKAALARGDRMGLAVLVGLYMGLRRAEIAALRWDHIDDEGWVMVVGKGEVTRWVFLHPIVAAELGTRAPSSSPWVFPGSRRGEHVNPATVWLWVREVGESAGLGRLQTHVLRHTNLAVMLERTGDLRTVADHAGHVSTDTTMIYTRTSRRRMKAAVLAVSFDDVAA